MKRLLVCPEAFVGHLLNEKNTLRFELSAMPMDFRPREGWLVEASGISHHLFYFCKRGSMRAEAGGSVFHLKAGDSVWIGPGTPFRLWSDEPSHFPCPVSTASGGFPFRPLCTESRPHHGSRWAVQRSLAGSCAPGILPARLAPIAFPSLRYGRSAFHDISPTFPHLLPIGKRAEI